MPDSNDLSLEPRHDPRARATPASLATDSVTSALADDIHARLNDAARVAFATVHCLAEVDSTNRWLADHLATSTLNHAVCCADSQLAGRGRRGRGWHSPPGGNIYLSIGWRFHCRQHQLGGLSLVAGVVAASAIAEQGVVGVGLKWPNDLLVERAKLGGILVESSLSGTQHTTCIIGLGINVALPVDRREGIGQQVTDLNTVAGRAINRAAIIAGIVNGFADALPVFEQRGLPAFHERFSALDCTCNRDVSVDDGQCVRDGHALGIDDDGALLVRMASGIERVYAGDVSVRVTS